MSDTGLEPATITNVSRPGSKPIQCMFNPKEYTFSKQNSWTQKKAAGANVPKLEFGGGQPATLQMQLFFDTYHEAESAGSAEDVRKKYTDALWDLMIVDPKLADKKNKKGVPPQVRFQWGTMWTFEAVITNMTQKFLLFAPNGTPVRATVDITFQQLKDQTQLSPQNPTSGGIGGERLWTVREGDTLALIAYQEYGDSTLWRTIANANRLQSVRRIQPGRVLVIPVL